MENMKMLGMLLQPLEKAWDMGNGKAGITYKTQFINDGLVYEFHMTKDLFNTIKSLKQINGYATIKLEPKDKGNVRVWLLGFQPE